MVPRSYVSPVRTAAAEAKRRQVIEAAAEFLRTEPLSAFSVDTVAKAAGVTRLTVYNQFGSRRGLLEATFDHLAEHGRLDRIGEAMMDPQPRQGLERLVEVFCDFWSGDLAVGRLHDAMATDAEFAQALTARNERRRGQIATLVERLSPKAAAQQRRDTVDLVFTLMSYPVFRLLSEGRSPADTCALIKMACADAITRISAGP